MKLFRNALAVILLTLSLESVPVLSAQSNAGAPIAAVPTTRILAIGHIAEGTARLKGMRLIH